MRRVVLVVLLVTSVALVVGFQVTRPERAAGNARVFVPSAAFFEELSPSFRTSIADIYYLYMVQYYGEHVEGDGRLDSMGNLVDLVTRLSPRFTKAYQFGTFALLDAGEGALAYEILQRGVATDPNEWQLSALAGFLVYQYGQGKTKNEVAAEWYEKAAAVEGAPLYLARLAAVITAKSGEREKAILMWGPIYGEGDKYSQDKAVEELDELLPKDRDARMEAVAPLAEMMPEERFEELLGQLFEDYL